MLAPAKTQEAQGIAEGNHQWLEVEQSLQDPGRCIEDQVAQVVAPIQFKTEINDLSLRRMRLKSEARARLVSIICVNIL